MRKIFMILLTMMFILGACSQGSSGDNGNNGSSESNDGGGDTVKIGVVAPLTGPAALYGEQVEAGAKLAAKLINEEGGILGGKQIELVIEDDQSKPEVGLSKYKELIEVKNVDAITGGVNSSVSMATKDIANDRILNIVTISKAPEIMADRDNYRFRLNSTNDMDGESFHKFISETLQPKTVAVIVENTDYGQAEIEALRRNWSSENDPEIVGVEFFELEDTDYTNPLTKLKSLNADALYVVGAAIEINSAVFSQAHQLGFNDTMKILSPGNINMEVVKLAGEGGEGVISADLYQNSIDNEMNKMFVEKFEKEYGYLPEKMELLGFESIWLTTKAMDQAGSANDYDKIAEILSSNTWESPRGEVVFENGQAQGEVLPLVIKNGEIVPYEQ